MKSKVIDMEFSSNWTTDDWIQWAYKLGLHLDRWIPWAGVDNRERIELVILEFVESKIGASKMKQEDILQGLAEVYCHNCSRCGQSNLSRDEVHELPRFKYICLKCWHKEGGKDE